MLLFFFTSSCAGVLRLWKQTRIRKHGAFSRAACQAGRAGDEGGRRLSLLLSVFVSSRGGAGGRSLGWNGEGGRGGQTRHNDPRPAVKRQSYKFIYLLSADLSSRPAGRGEPPLTHNASACHNTEENAREEE